MIIYNHRNNKQSSNEREEIKMNIENYQMDFDERREYVRSKALDILANNDEAFCEAVEDLIFYNNFIEEKCFPMEEIDEICYGMKPSEIINQMTSDFDANDDYFYFSIWGLESTNDKAGLYRDKVDEDDVLDALEENYNQITLYNSELDELVKTLYNDDFGIELDFEADEDMSKDDMPEETDDEFKDRIDSI